MGLEKFEIHFDNPSAAYFGGQTLSGRLDITLDAPKKLRGISIVIKGEANTQWTEHDSYTDSKGKRQSRTKHYHGNEKYFDINYYLMGGSNSPTTEIMAGTHTYTFTCALPPTLPSSFEGSKGHVRYTVKAVIDRPWKFDQTCKAAFTVIAPLDLNLIPRVKTCATLTMEKYFCCCWCKSGPLTGITKIPYTGFVPGQIIPMTIEVDNASTTDVLGVVLKLNQMVTYYSHGPSRKSVRKETEIAKCSVGSNGVPGRGSNTFRHDFTIPSLPPSNLSNCGIIDIDYEIKVKLDIPGFHSSLRGNIPITIGTVPLNNIAQVMSLPPEQTTNVVGLNAVVPSGEQPVLGWVPPAVVPGQDAYSLPPPTYEECQFGTNSIMDSTDTEHTKGAIGYAPTYPVYNFGLMPQPPTGYMPLLPGAPMSPSGYMPIAPPAELLDATAPSAPVEKL